MGVAAEPRELDDHPQASITEQQALVAQPTELSARLKAVGLRVTAPRLAVLEALAASGHSTADRVADQVRNKLGTVSTQTIYGALATLTERGLARQIEPAGHNRLFEARTADNHHHLICRGCHRIEDVDCAVGLAPCLEAKNDQGFVIDEAEVIYWGLCPACQAAERATDRGADHQDPEAAPDQAVEPAVRPGFGQTASGYRAAEPASESGASRAARREPAAKMPPSPPTEAWRGGK
jgi:Fur family ferric uptake transcriptional regulator